jgi:metal transporter CNNM
MIGANMTWFVWIIIVLTFPISYPIAKLLDCILGENHGTFFRRAELKELVSLHGSNAAGADQLTLDETTIIRGALDMQDKTARHAMTALEKVFTIVSIPCWTRIRWRN